MISKPSVPQMKLVSKKHSDSKRNRTDSCCKNKRTISSKPKKLRKLNNKLLKISKNKTKKIREFCYFNKRNRNVGIEKLKKRKKGSSAKPRRNGSV